MSEARRVGSSEAPMSAGRDVGWIVCQAMRRVSAMDVGERWVTYVQQGPTGGGV